MKKKAILVLGMHRSGTSMVSGCLKLAGVDFGKSLMYPTKENAKGYWEQNDIVIVHEKLLAAYETSWHSVGALPKGWLDRPESHSAEKQLTDIVRANFSGSDLFAIKDPRMCRFLPLWERVFQALSIEVIYLHVIRHPLESAKSISKRDSCSINKGLALWVAYNADIVHNIGENVQYIKVGFSEFLKDPISSTNAILKQAGLSELDQEKEKRISHFCNQKLRNHRSENFDEVSDAIAKFHHNISNGDSISKVPIPSEPILEYLSDTERKISEYTLKYDSFINILENAEQPFTVAQLFISDSEGNYTGDRIYSEYLQADTWTKLRFEISKPHSIHRNGFRFDPTQIPGEIEISSWSLVRTDSQDVLFESFDFTEVKVEGTAFRLERTDNPLKIISDGSDPRCIFPAIDIPADIPVTIEFWVRYRRSMPSLREILLYIPKLKKQLIKYEDLKERIRDFSQSKSVSDTLIQKHASKRFRQECLRPISHVRKFTSRKIKWFDARLPRPALPIDELTTAYEKNEIAESLMALINERLFDAAWYLEQYPEAQSSPLSPFFHYLKIGWKEGKNPSPRFNVESYLKARPDVAANGVEPLSHYHKYGRHEA